MQKEKILYHGSPHKLTEIQAHTPRGNTDFNSQFGVYMTDSIDEAKLYSLARDANRNNKGWGLKNGVLTLRKDKWFPEGDYKLNDVGYVHIVKTDEYEKNPYPDMPHEYIIKHNVVPDRIIEVDAKSMNDKIIYMDKPAYNKFWNIENKEGGFKEFKESKEPKKSKDIVFLLIPGFGSSEIWWEYMYDTETKLIKPVTFLRDLKKLGSIYKFTFPWFNIDYYYNNPDRVEATRWKKYYKKYKPHSSNINFTLKDLDYDVICRDLHARVRQKFPTQKIVPIGHSYGAPIAYIFSKMYPRECAFCCMLDGSPLGKTLQQKFFKDFEQKNTTMINKVFPNNAALQEVLQKIRTKDNPNKEIKQVMELISYRSTLWKVKHLSDKVKLYCPTLLFRSVYLKPKGYEKMWNIWSEEEEKINPNGRYIYYLNAPHSIWHDKKCSDNIIEHIKNNIT